MTPTHLIALALALASTLSRPSAAFPDRYATEAQATDPGRVVEAPVVDGDRQKRAYTTWNGYGSFSRWKPALYQLSRPYFIPTYGASDKIPIYFPPQRLNLNPGTPVHNPLPNRPFRGPGYLPPTSEEPTTMKIDNRNIFDDDQDRPVWGTSPIESNEKEEEVIPTRPPRPPTGTAFPPLVHDSSGSSSNKIQASSLSTTARSIDSGPSNCVWAIVSCCSVSSNVVPDRCFEQRGCSGPFWGPSPCDSEFAKAAIASALNYYGK